MNAIQFVVIGLIVLFTVMFIVCAIVFPELVGIAGKKAKEIEGEHHRGDHPEDQEDLPTEKNESGETAEKN